MGNNRRKEKKSFFFLFSFFLFLFSFLFFSPSLFAKGKKDTTEKEPINNEWILCVTAFEYKLSSSRRITGDVITRSLVDKLKTIDYRLRISHEYAYYEGYAWQQTISVTAKAISSKQNERSQLLYRGDPGWKYQRDLKKIDEDLQKLQEELAAKEAERPVVNNEPSFALCQANLGGTYPAAPKINGSATFGSGATTGSERRFCQNQKADAFITGEVREFHGRYYIKLRMFTLFTNSWVYEDDIIFSLDDIDGAVNEIAARLTTMISGNKPAAVAVRANPPQAQVLINQSYAGTGAVEARERPPGKVVIAVSAEGYDPLIIEEESSAGELLDVEVELSPQQYGNVHIDIPGKTGIAVYHGALYVGEAPLTLRLPIDQLNYVSVDSKKGESRKVVFSSPDMPEGEFSVSLKLKPTRPSGEKRVDKVRKQYYWSWAGVWITGVTAWVTSGIYSSQLDTWNKGQTDPAFGGKVNRMYWVKTSALIALGVAAVYNISQMTRYLYVASQGAAPIVKQPIVKHKKVKE